MQQDHMRICMYFKMCNMWVSKIHSWPQCESDGYMLYYTYGLLGRDLLWDPKTGG